MSLLGSLKELAEIKKRLSDLEANVNKPSAGLFGRSYKSAGSPNADFLIKTKGQVKILFGNKFIDLIKDGKINVDSKFIYKQDSVGNKDGIYVIGEGDETKVVLYVGGTEINLKEEIGTTYVSFLETQETTPELKYTALTNIGFIYKNIEDVDPNRIENGIIYVEKDLRLYVLREGVASKYYTELPDQINSQIVIKNETANMGSVVILGENKKNSLSFDKCFIYRNLLDLNLESEGALFLKSFNEANTIAIEENFTSFTNEIIAPSFKSESYDSKKGFKLYEKNGQSFLDVDNIIVRNKEDLQQNNIYPIYWNFHNNIILSIHNAFSDVEQYLDLTIFNIKLLYENKFQVGDILYIYVNSKPELYIKQTPISLLLIQNYEDSNMILAAVLSEIDDIIDITKLLGGIIFLIKRGNNTLLRFKESSVDLVNLKSHEDAISNDNVTTRIGNLEELNKTYREDNLDLPITGYGIYSDNASFVKAQYTSDYNLPADDVSSKFASTEWVSNFLPVGSIIMYNGLSLEIPSNWHICDGTNGTPNLIGKFIKASNIAGQTGGLNEITLTTDNMPRHSHRVSGGIVETSVSGAHVHSYNSPVYGDGNNTGTNNAVETFLNDDTALSGDHTHNIDLSTISIEETGNGVPINCEPLYYSLIYIMKLK